MTPAGIRPSIRLSSFLGLVGEIQREDIHDLRLGDRSDLEVAERPLHRLLEIGDSHIEVGGLHQGKHRALLLGARFLVEHQHIIFHHIIFVAAVVEEDFGDFRLLDGRDGKFAGDIGLHGLDDAGLSLRKRQRIHEIRLVNLLHHTIIHHLVEADLAFKPKCHIEYFKILISLKLDKDRKNF